MTKPQVWTIQALRNLQEKDQLIIPKYQRKIRKVDNLQESLEFSARKDGFIPGVVVLRRIGEVRNQGKLEIVDSRRRLDILLRDKKIAGSVRIFVVELTDYSMKDAIALYKHMNTSGVVHTTGEKLHADLSQDGLSSTLQSFVKNSVWAKYDGEKRDTRFKHIPIALQHFFESQAARLEKWNIQKAPVGYKAFTAAVPKVIEEDVNQDAQEAMIARFQKIQQVVERAYDKLKSSAVPLINQNVYWPAAWMHVAIGSDADVFRKSVIRLSDGFIQWRKTTEGMSLDTSHPERAPQGKGTHIGNLSAALSQA